MARAKLNSIEIAAVHILSVSATSAAVQGLLCIPRAAIGYTRS